MPSAPALAPPSWVPGPRGGQQHPEAAGKGPSREQPAASSWPWLLGRKPRGAAACARLELVSAITCVLLTPFGAGIRLPSPTQCINENKSSAIHCGTWPMWAGTARSNAEAPLPPPCPERQVTACPPSSMGLQGTQGGRQTALGLSRLRVCPRQTLQQGAAAFGKPPPQGHRRHPAPSLRGSRARTCTWALPKESWEPLGASKKGFSPLLLQGGGGISLSPLHQCCSVKPPACRGAALPAFCPRRLRRSALSTQQHLLLSPQLQQQAGQRLGVLCKGSTHILSTTHPQHHGTGPR